MIKNKSLLFCICFFVCSSAYANWFQDIIDTLIREGNISNPLLSSINSQQRGILESQKEVENLMRQVNGSVTGNSGWGTYQSHDYQSYGVGANNWASVLQMIKHGGSSGALGQAVNSITNEFPIDNNAFNKGVINTQNQKYYATQTQTILAARAASQLDYDKIQDQISYQQMLQQQIENTKNLKAAVDLNNRIQVENNLINLEILRQSAIANQQQAISGQGNMNNALANAKFLTKE